MQHTTNCRKKVNRINFNGNQLLIVFEKVFQINETKKKKNQCGKTKNIALNVIPYVQCVFVRFICSYSVNGLVQRFITVQTKNKRNQNVFEQRTHWIHSNEIHHTINPNGFLLKWISLSSFLFLWIFVFIEGIK